MEVWKKIPIAPDYEASTLGNIRSLKNNKIKPMRPSKDGVGYLRAALRIDGKYLNKRVHQLVAITFLPNPDNKPQVNHKIPIKSLNSVENLEWVTAKENIRHSFANGLVGRKKGENSLIGGGKHYCAKGVINTETGIFYECIKDAAVAHNIKHSTLRAMLNGYRKNRTSLLSIN